MDPRFTFDGPNLFRYCSNNPMRQTDSEGMQAIAGPQEYRDLSRRSEANAWFAARGYDVLNWDTEERLWRIAPRIDNSIGGLEMRNTGSTGGARPMVYDPTTEDTGNVPIPEEDIERLLENGDDPFGGLEGSLTGLEGSSGEGGFARGSSREGSRFGSETGSSEGSLLTGGEGGTEPSTILNEVVAATAILNLDVTGYDPNNTNTTDSGVPSGSLGLLDFGSAINNSLYLAATFGTMVFGMVVATLSRLKEAVQTIRRSAVFRSFSSLSSTELRAIKSYFSTLNSTGSHRLAGTAFHQEMGAAHIGTDLLRSGAGIELKTALRQAEDINSVIEAASAQSLRDATAWSRLASAAEGAPVAPIRMVKVYDMARKVVIITH